MSGTTCTCGNGCATYGQCLRQKRISVGYCRSAAGWDYSRQKRWDAELAEFRSAVDQGVTPAGTTTGQIRRAMEISERTGVPYDASAKATPMAGI